MKEESSKYSKISKVGPMFKIEGGLIFKHPFQSYALKGYDSEIAFRDSEPFLNSISSMASNWFEKFPYCCDTHREIAQLGNFDKTKFEFIPSQILNNIKYFAYCLETFIGEENGMDEIKDYLDYLIESFGRPSVGGHLFERIVKHFIENGTVDNKEFTDDKRLELLTHLEPTNPPSDLDERALDSLYTAFQKWLDAMPNVGKFKELKERLKGKIPLNIFFIEPKHNKYLGLSSFKTRSRNELLKFLVNMTNDILNLSKVEIKKENYDNDKLIIAAEERLRIKQDILLESGNSDLETSYLNLVEKWLSIVIEFYQVISQAIEETNSKHLSRNINDVLSKLDALQVEIASLCNSNRIFYWLKNYLPDKSFEELINELDKLKKEEGKVVLDSMVNKLQTSGIDDFKLEALTKKINNPEIAIKHKLKLSIPLFLFIKYEGEIELCDKQKLPRNFKELKELLIE
jgi:hypothetical protein